VNYGKNLHRLCVILDVVDQNRVLVDGPHPTTGVKRQMVSLRRLSLTSLKLRIPRGAREKTLKKAFTKAKIAERWKKSAWAKKLEAKTKRAALNDFGRFQVFLARKKRSRLAKPELSKLKKVYIAKKKAEATKRKAKKSTKKA